MRKYLKSKKLKNIENYKGIYTTTCDNGFIKIDYNIYKNGFGTKQI